MDSIVLNMCVAIIMGQTSPAEAPILPYLEETGTLPFDLIRAQAGRESSV